ncbi:LPS export ABC transporter periplasmic protein LptC [Maridesulfovibrio bastinii]|uniref:LPS export ABC transporter periplasmic protein LptC n=1 Tax=Maridesulfovibrio bastinii TaxID=47157 RepID=UPI00041250AC|nr:LPS export ABC transporter periplasmic protein LptC [Maridesulfovibrio bastinii]
MSLRRVWGLGIAMLVCGVIVGAYLARHYNPVFYGIRQEIKAPPVRSNGTSDVSVDGIELTQGTGGDIEWKLKAGSADYDQEKGLVIADKPEVTYFLGRDRKEVVVRAVHGEVSQKGKGLRLWKNVRGHYGELALKAENLHFNPKKNFLILNGNVILNSHSLFVEAPKVSVNLKTREITVDNNVEALISPDVLTTSKQK